MNNYIAILGASDPEMEATETLLVAAGVRVVYATAGGTRVHPGNAYRADVPPELSEQWDGVIAVECEWRDMPVDVVRADHHRHGDYGYGLPPSEFLRASSLGQVITWLAMLCRARRRITRGGSVCLAPEHDALRDIGWDTVNGGSHFDNDDNDGYSVGPWSGDVAEAIADYPHAIQRFPDGRYGVLVACAGHELGGCFSWLVIPRDLVLTAAADHCLGAAYRGECPGVDPDELLAWRVRSRARYQHRFDSERGTAKGDVAHYEALIRERIEAARQELQDADREYIGRPGPDCGDPQCYCCWDGVPWVCDMRRDTPLDELVEAATRDGVAYIAGPFIGPDGRHKFTASGAPEVIRAFMTHWAPRNGLTDIYGDPARGFAGGYEP